MTGRKGQVWAGNDGYGVYLLLHHIVDELEWYCLVLDDTGFGDDARRRSKSGIIKVADCWLPTFAKRIA